VNRHAIKRIGGGAVEIAAVTYRANMSISPGSISLSPEAIRLVDGRNYAVLATINKDGSPQTSAMWVGLNGNDVLMSTVEGRLKHRNMVRDPRVSVTVIDSADPENYVELRGTVTMAPDIGTAFDNSLSWKYDGRDKDPDRPGAVRVIVRVTVTKATGPGAA
jgi:PPOX class probable F420-dependent enzyme